MEIPADKYQKKLCEIKDRVRNSHDYFKHNYDRYNEFNRFVFESTLTDDEVTLLETLGRPQLEFNILEAYISRLLGEWSKQEPDIAVNADDETHADPNVIKLLEMHFKHLFTADEMTNVRYEVMKDLLAGGFSVMKVCTDYANPMSFTQVIKMERAYDPTLCGFDPLAKTSHKGDGDFCYELFPMSEIRFKAEYPDIPTNEITFSRNFEGFNWSYINGKEKILLICDYYEKKRKRVKIVQLRDGRVMTEKEYKEKLDMYTGLEPFPAVVGKPRMTELEIICRYRLMDNTVLEYVETDYAMLPLVFFDGSSRLIRTQKNANVRQVCRPYVYHAKGTQRLKNFLGINVANAAENLVQHKFMVAREAMPKEEEFLSAYKDVQKASTLVYNAFLENNPEQPIQNPINQIQQVALPPEIYTGFMGADQVIQNVLGSYDAALGINQNQLSGVAIVEAASQSNATAMPYIVGFLNGLQRVAEIYLDLFPKYYTTPRTIPVKDEKGRRHAIPINQNGQNIFYDANALNVVVSAGPSFQVQKSRTLMMVKEMMGMSPLFAQFIAEKGLNFVLDNMEGRGIEQLKMMVDEWVQEMEQAKKMAQAQQQAELQNNPAMIKAQNERMKLKLNAAQSQQDFMLDLEKLKQDQNKLLSDAALAEKTNAVQLVKAQTERFAKEIDLILENNDQKHRHAKETIELHHKLKERSEKPNTISGE